MQPVNRDPGTIVDALDRRAAARPDDELLRLAGGPAVTASQLDERSRVLSEGLARRIAAGDAVLTSVQPGPEAIAITVALGRLGAIEVPLPIHASREWAERLARLTSARILLTNPEHLESSPHLSMLGTDRLWPTVLVTAESPTPVTEHLLPTLDELAAAPTPLRRAAPRAEDPALVMSTSGTTGRPKGALLRHSVGVGQAFRVQRAMEYDESDAIYSFFPWQHINSRHAAFLPAVISGARLVISPKFSASRFWDVCRSEGVTAFNFMGAVCAILLRNAPNGADRDHGVQTAYGGPAPQRLAEEFLRRFGVTLLQAYACTELADVSTSSRGDQAAGAAGRPVPEYRVRVLDQAGSPADVGESGDIVVSPGTGGLTFDEYVGEPDATAAAWKDGWFQTTDRGHLDAEGRLWIEGRSVDVIRRRGINISAWDVESTVTLLGGVAEAVAVGVPSELTEDEIMVVVVSTDGIELSEEEIWRWCSNHLPRHAIPRFISIEQRLPLNDSLKVARVELRDRGIPDGCWDAERPHENLGSHT